MQEQALPLSPVGVNGEMDRNPSLARHHRPVALIPRKPYWRLRVGDAASLRRSFETHLLPAGGCRGADADASLSRDGRQWRRHGRQPDSLFARLPGRPSEDQQSPEGPTRFRDDRKGSTPT